MRVCNLESSVTAQLHYDRLITSIRDTVSNEHQRRHENSARTDLPIAHSVSISAVYNLGFPEGSFSTALPSSEVGVTRTAS